MAQLLLEASASPSCRHAKLWHACSPDVRQSALETPPKVLQVIQVFWAGFRTFGLMEALKLVPCSEQAGPRAEPTNLVLLTRKQINLVL